MPNKNGNLTQKDLLKLLNKNREEDKALIQEITSAVNNLDKIRQNYEKSIYSFLKGNLKEFLILIIIICIGIIFYINDGFSIKFGNFEITKQSVCNSNINQSNNSQPVSQKLPR